MKGMMTVMKKIFFCVFAVLLISTNVAAENLKIAVFDAQEVLDNIDEGKAAVARLEKEASSKKKVIEEKQKELEKLKKDLDSQTLVLSKDALEKKREELQMKYIDFERSRVEAQKEMQQKELTETGEIFKKINAVIQKMGKEDNYDFKLKKNQGAVTYFKSGNITKQVIELYNKTYKAK